MVDPIKIRMLSTQKGSPDGVALIEYVAGTEHLFETAAGVDLARVFLRQKWAEEVVEQIPLPVPETKPVAAVEPVETKPLPRAPAKKAPRRRGRPPKNRKP